MMRLRALAESPQVGGLEAAKLTHKRLHAEVKRERILEEMRSLQQIENAGLSLQGHGAPEATRSPEAAAASNGLTAEAAQEGLEVAKMTHKRIHAEVKRERILEEMRSLRRLEGGEDSSQVQDIAQDLAEAAQELQIATMAHKRLQAEVDMQSQHNMTHKPNTRARPDPCAEDRRGVDQFLSLSLG